jgi:hypothetical protein
LYALITELVRVEDPEHGKDGSDDDEDDDEDDERNKALGLGGLKAVIKDMLSASSGLVKGGEVVTILWERMRNNSGYVTWVSNRNVALIPRIQGPDNFSGVPNLVASSVVTVHPNDQDLEHSRTPS